MAGDKTDGARGAGRKGMINSYIYQYWVVRDADRSDVMAGPFNSEYEAWLERDDNSDWVVVKTKHRVLDTSED